jgi:fatty acid amide hydrolase
MNAIMLEERTESSTDQIVSLTASELARWIRQGDLSSAEVVAAHIERIEQVNPRINAVTQPLYEQARAEAERADQKLARIGDQASKLPPLFGVPVTVKDCFDVRGTDCTLGIDARVGRPAAHDSPLVARLRAAGAIVLGKTNTHQGMLMHEADNPVFGRTNHPLDGERTPGGSSGGEAAIVAALGSPLGLASDLGGSIRHPAHSCGVCGIKPTTGRLTAAGSYRAMPGMQAVALQPGPLVRSVEDVDLAMRVFSEKSKTPRLDDETIDPWPDFRRVSVEGLRIGWLEDDGYFRPAPAIRRATREAVDALADRGAVVEPFTIPEIREAMRIYTGLVSADGLASLRRMVRGSRREAQLARQLRLGSIPRWLRTALQPALKMLGEQYLAELIEWTGRRSVDAYWDLTVEADAYRKRFAAAVEQATSGPLDVIVMPPHGLPALRHGTALDALPAASYCFLPNLLGWPAGVVPFATVQPDEQSDRPELRDRVVRTARRVEQGSSGLPVGVQVLARPWREDVTLAVMTVLEEAATASQPTPPTA